MKTRNLLLSIILCVCFWGAVVPFAADAFGIPSQPKAVDVVQAFSQMKGEWTRVNGWNYKFQLLEQYFDGRDEFRKRLTWCVTAARASKKAFYRMTVLNGFDGQEFKMHDSIAVERVDQPCEGIRPGPFRTPKGGR